MPKKLLVQLPDYSYTLAQRFAVDSKRNAEDVLLSALFNFIDLSAGNDFDVEKYFKSAVNTQLGTNKIYLKMGSSGFDYLEKFHEDYLKDDLSFEKFISFIFQKYLLDRQEYTENLEQEIA